MKDRVIRLGIPLLVYNWIVSPLTWAVVNYMLRGQPLSWEYFIPGVSGTLIGNGPLWFVEVLLVFTVIYVAWRKMFRPAAPVPPVQTDSRFPGSKAIVLFAVLMAVATFMVRLLWPTRSTTTRHCPSKQSSPCRSCGRCCTPPSRPTNRRN